MPLSRLRLGLTARFALAFVAGLTLLNLGLYWYVGHRASRRLDVDLHAAARELSQSIERERREGPDTSLVRAAREALGEWPAGDYGFVAFAPDGARLGSAGLDRLVSSVTSFPADLTALHRHLRVINDGSASAGGGPAIVVIGSTGRLHEDQETLATWMLVSAPVVLLLSLILGYVLSRQALSPVDALGAAIGGMTPDDLSLRLPVREPADEVDRLTAHFNRLLDRLAASGEQNQRFLQRAAHQLRTPLTLVLGESQLSLERSRTAEEQTATMRRIRTAAEQMSHRVADLFLLASVQAGERLPLRERVELDGLAAEAADLMRGRAQSLGRRLEMGEIVPAEVVGDERLLREAVVELLENACRHGSDETPIAVSLTSSAIAARITVTNSGPPLPDEWPQALSRASTDLDPRGLGLSIVSWIADAHRGALEVERIGSLNRLSIRIPLPQE